MLSANVTGTASLAAISVTFAPGASATAVALTVRLNVGRP